MSTASVYDLKMTLNPFEIELVERYLKRAKDVFESAMAAEDTGADLKEIGRQAEELKTYSLYKRTEKLDFYLDVKPLVTRAIGIVAENIPILISEYAYEVDKVKSCIRLEKERQICAAFDYAAAMIQIAYKSHVGYIVDELMTPVDFWSEGVGTLGQEVQAAYRDELYHGKKWS